MSPATGSGGPLRSPVIGITPGFIGGGGGGGTSPEIFVGIGGGGGAMTAPPGGIGGGGGGGGGTGVDDVDEPPLTLPFSSC